MDLATYKYYKHVFLSREDATELGNEIYRFFKAIQPKYLKNGKFIRQYEVLFDKLLDIERLLRGYRIIDYEIKSSGTQEVDSIIEAVREGILKEHIGFNKETFTKIDLANSCLKVSKAFTKVALKQGLKCRMVKIYPGYKERSYLYDTDGEGRTLFSDLTTVGAYFGGKLVGFIQYGRTSFGFDENGEISNTVFYSVIRNK